MLSRIAESLFWIGRYVERAEDTARILDVQTQLLLEDPRRRRGDRPAAACSSIMGVEFDDDARVDTAAGARALAYDTTPAASIAAALGRRPGERPPGPRDAVGRRCGRPSTPPTARSRPGSSARCGRRRGFRWVRDRAALINGTADATMTRDEGWQFLMLGRCIERADMTSRLVATAAYAGGIGSPWTTTLRACGGYEAFLRTYKGLETERGAAEFLLLDRLFPRSVVFALNRAEQCLDNLEAAGQRAGFQNEAQRLLGRTRAELEYRSLSDVVADLPGEMERLQRTCALATDAVTRRYFAGAEAHRLAGRCGHEHAAADRPHDRLRVRRQGDRVVQPGPADAADHARPDRRAHAGSRCRPTPWTYDLPRLLRHRR